MYFLLVFAFVHLNALLMIKPQAQVFIGGMRSDSKFR